MRRLLGELRGAHFLWQPRRCAGLSELRVDPDEGARVQLRRLRGHGNRRGPSQPGRRRLRARLLRRQLRRQLAPEQPAPDLLFPITYRVNARGHLEIGGCDLADLAAAHGTPPFTYDEATIRQPAAEIVSAMGKAGRLPYTATTFTPT